MSKSSVLMVGCGDIAQRLFYELPRDEYVCFGLRRDVAALPPGLQGLRGDYLDPSSLSELRGVRPDFLVMTLKPSQYDADGYWKGFVQGARNILAALDRQSLRRILVISSTRVYAETGGAWIDEESPLNAAHFASAALLAMEAELGDRVPTVALRCGGIYGDPRGMLITRVMEGRFLPPQPLRYGNRIHRDDVARALAHFLHLAMLEKSTSAVYNVVDSEPASQAEVERFIAAELGIPQSNDTALLDQSSHDAGHKRISNARLLASGFQLRYPDFRSGYRAVLRERQNQQA